MKKQLLPRQKEINAETWYLLHLLNYLYDLELMVLKQRFPNLKDHTSQFFDGYWAYSNSWKSCC